MSDNADIRYGRMLEAGAAAVYSAERLSEWATGLLESGEWKKVGPGFEDPNDFLRSGVDLSALKAHPRLLEAFEIAASEAGASNRAIGEATDQHGTTVGRHLGGAAYAAPGEDEAAPDQGKQEDLTAGGAADAAPDEEDALPGMPAGQETADALLSELDDQIANSTGDTEPEPDPEPAPKPAPVMLQLRTHTGEVVEYPKPASKATFNETTGEGISWAAWSWNPVTGCLHGCDYCYARAIANRFTDSYPVGFTPLFHHERLDAPANTTIPTKYREGGHEPCGNGDCQTCAYRRVFVCSMADLYGRWVPDEWIQQVHASMLASPTWQYILLTKFPARYAGLELPAGAWVGTSVDEQKRVRIAQDAFRKIDGVRVKWLSLEPLREPLEFDDLSMFDWVVIGAQTETRQPGGTVPAFDPEPAWVHRITAQALEAGCRVHWKPNLRRAMAWPNQYPEG